MSRDVLTISNEFKKRLRIKSAEETNKKRKLQINNEYYGLNDLCIDQEIIPSTVKINDNVNQKDIINNLIKMVLKMDKEIQDLKRDIKNMSNYDADTESSGQEYSYIS